MLGCLILQVIQQFKIILLYCMLQSYTSEGQSISVLEEILGEKKPARKWYEKYRCLFCWYVKKE